MSRTRAEARTITERKRVGMKRQAAPRRGGSRGNEARAARGQRNHGRIAGLLQHPLHVKGLGSPPLPTRSFYSVINLRPAPPSRSGRPPCRWQTESPSERRINFSTVKEREERTRRGGCVRAPLLARTSRLRPFVLSFCFLFRLCGTREDGPGFRVAVSAASS